MEYYSNLMAKLAKRWLKNSESYIDESTEKLANGGAELDEKWLNVEWCTSTKREELVRQINIKKEAVAFYKELLERYWECSDEEFVEWMDEQEDEHYDLWNEINSESIKYGQISDNDILAALDYTGECNKDDEFDEFTTLTKYEMWYVNGEAATDDMDFEELIDYLNRERLLHHGNVLERIEITYDNNLDGENDGYTIYWKTREANNGRWFKYYKYTIVKKDNDSVEYVLDEE